MGDDYVAQTLRRLHHCQEAADIIYSANAVRTLSTDSKTITSAGEAATTEDYTTDDGEVNAAATAGAQDVFSMMVARRIGTMVARLNDLASPSGQLALTPRMILYELMDIIRQGLYTSLPENMQSAVALSNKAAVVNQFSLYISSRQVPLESAAEGLHTVSYVSVKLRVELVSLQLRRRIQEELRNKNVEASDDPRVAALVVTDALLEDLIGVYNNIVLTMPVTRDSGMGGLNPQEAEAAEHLVPLFIHYYYQLCDWVLVLESTMRGPTVSSSRVKRLVIDEQKGVVQLDLHRPTKETPWGLLLNEQGRLVDIDVSMRQHEKAKRLHSLLQAASQGAVVIRVNDTDIPAPVEGQATDYAQNLIATLQSVSSGRKHVQLQIQSMAFLESAMTLPMEVAFVAPPQGGEGASGQRVTLVLRRQSTATKWGFKVDEKLSFVPPALHIFSDAVQSFLKEYGGHLRLLAVNGVEALHATQVELIVQSAETVALELLVMPSFMLAGASSSSPLPSKSVLGTIAGALGLGEGAKSPPEGVAATKEGDRVNTAVMEYITEGRKQLTEVKVNRARGGGVDAIGDKPLMESIVERPSAAGAAAETMMVKRKRGRPPASTVTTTTISTHSASLVSTGASSIADGLQSAVGAAVDELKSVEEKLRGRSPKASSMDGEEGKDAAATNPCVFDNKVSLMRLSDEEMVLERPSMTIPWGLPIGRIADPTEAPSRLPLRLMSLPATRKSAVRRHPYFAQFKRAPSTWFIASVNGKSATNAEATLKDIGKLTRMTIRFLRK